MVVERVTFCVEKPCKYMNKQVWNMAQSRKDPKRINEVRLHEFGSTMVSGCLKVLVLEQASDVWLERSNTFPMDHPYDVKYVLFWAERCAEIDLVKDASINMEGLALNREIALHERFEAWSIMKILHCVLTVRTSPPRKPGGQINSCSAGIERLGSPEVQVLSA
jgi:hypothetical protein